MGQYVLCGMEGVLTIYDVLLYVHFLEIIYVYSEPFTCFHNLVALGYLFIIATNK